MKKFFSGDFIDKEKVVVEIPKLKTIIMDKVQHEINDKYTAAYAIKGIKP